MDEKKGDQEELFEVPDTLLKFDIEELLVKCEEGDKSARQHMEYIVDNDLGDNETYQKILNFFEKGARKGDPIACWCLSDLYQTGRGVEKNEKKSFELQMTSAEKGDVFGIRSVGILYLNGIGTSKDIKKAEV